MNAKHLVFLFLINCCSLSFASQEKELSESLLTPSSKIHEKQAQLLVDTLRNQIPIQNQSLPAANIEEEARGWKHQRNPCCLSFLLGLAAPVAVIMPYLLNQDDEVMQMTFDSVCQKDFASTLCELFS